MSCSLGRTINCLLLVVINDGRIRAILVLFAKSIVGVASEAEGYLGRAIMLVDPLADAIAVARCMPPLVIVAVVAVPRRGGSVPGPNDLHLTQQQVLFHFGRFLRVIDRSLLKLERWRCRCVSPSNLDLALWLLLELW